MNRGSKMSINKIKFFIALIFVLIFLAVFFMFSEGPPLLGVKFDQTKNEDISRSFQSGRPGPKGAIDNYLSPIFEKLSLNPHNGIDENLGAKYTIMDSSEITEFFKTLRSPNGIYFESIDISSDPVVFIKKVTNKSGNGIIAKIEVKKEKILWFPGSLFSKPFMFFMIMMVTSGIAVYFIFSFYRLAVDAQTESQKHQSIQRLSRGLAHEIRNPLNAMRMSLEMINRGIAPVEMENKAEVDEYMAILKDEIMRLDGLVNRFMEYSKDIKLNYSKTKIKQLIESAVRVISPLADEKKAAISLAGDLDIEIDIDGDIIYRCILNIIKNAVESIAANGKIEISCHRTKKGCEIKITDDGEGIPAENLSRVFEFYFSTKSEGSGIGLALSKKFIEAHAGTISASSENNLTCFSINLPDRIARQ